MKSHPAILGAFLVSGLLLFATGLFLVGDRHQAFSRHEVLYAEMANVNGLMQGSKVRVDGLDAGQLTNIELPERPSGKFRLRLDVATKVDQMIRDDSFVTVESDGLVGDRFVLIHSGSDASPKAIDGSTLRSKEPMELSAMMEKVSGVVDQANATMGDVHLKLNRVLDGFKATIDNTNGLVSDARAGKGTVGMLLNNPQTAGQVSSIISNSQLAADRLNQASQQAAQMMSDLNSKQLPEKIDESVANVRRASEQIDEVSQNLNASLSNALAPDPSGADAAQNIQEMLANVNVATANLADDTEALKHNFLLRGFFKRRGFYTLKNLTPAEYRRDAFFQNPRNRRFWLGAEWFAQDENGKQYLTREGQLQIDHLAEGFGDSLVGRPLVVEGYSSVPESIHEVQLSNSHALLVAHYIEKRFSLRSSDIGVVSLNAVPPEFSGKSKWDGACIVLLSETQK